ncbi:MAG: hypothetical protein H6712_25420 [Myxococcales bacterium]|nr:hypothetical protein [Myxococcales bacterium]
MSKSKLRSAFIVTGVIAWVGGLGTAMIASSCDAEPCAVDPYDPACDPDPGFPGRAQQPTGCDHMARPSVYVLPVVEHDDYLLPAPVDMVWFQHEGETYEARCIATDEGCTGPWVAGYELEGPITVSTEYCETVVSQSVKVGRTEDGCHVATEYVILPVSTQGCEATKPEPSGGSLPPTAGPWALTLSPAE